MVLLLMPRMHDMCGMCRGLDEADFEKVADFFDRAVNLTVELKVRGQSRLLLASWLWVCVA